MFKGTEARNFMESLGNYKNLIIGRAEFKAGDVKKNEVGQ